MCTFKVLSVFFNTIQYTFKTFALLKCYAAQIGSYRRCGTTYRPHLQRSRNPHFIMYLHAK